MKKRLKQTIFFFATLFLLGSVLSASATSDKIDKLEEEKKKTEAELEDMNNQVNDLEDDKKDLQSDLTGYSSQMSDVKAEITNCHTKIEVKEAEIVATTQKLNETKITEEKQFAAMKERIRFMYENGDTGAVEALLGAENFADFINRADYIQSIMNYDRNMLQEYQRTREEIAKTEEQLQAEKKTLESERDKVQAAETKLANLINSTQDGINKYAEDIKAAEARALAYEKKLEEQENQLANLKEILAREQGLINGTTPVGKFKYHEISDLARKSSDLEVMAAIIECEAGGEPYEGQLAVGSVIMNRIKSDRFPNTLLEVLHQKNQFSPVRSGRFALVLARGANAECRAVAQEILNGRNTIDALFFRTVIPSIQGTIIGGHVFY